MYQSINLALWVIHQATAHETVKRGGRAKCLHVNAAAVPQATDPLMWRKQHVQAFPRLARMTRQYLAVPATTASNEVLFSSVGLVTSDLRDRLLDTTLIEVMWAKQAP
jgi:hypothetical protein